MRNLTYTLSPHSRSLRSLTPKKGVKGRSRTILKSRQVEMRNPTCTLHFNLTPEAFMLMV